MRTELKPKGNTRQHGSSLLEVMVALVVLGVGLLGVLAMQARSSQYGQSTYYYAQAVFLANDIADAMRTTPAVAGGYNILFDDPIPNAKTCESTTISCSAGELRDWNLNKWLTNVARFLPQGKASIQAVGDNTVITVRFNDARAQVDGSEKFFEYVLVTDV
ncbi:MAG TPA: type IV pilus modification protein PilV [Cellvibrionaceae bacterium]|nr:type IV pilus modification protein PilV [Cellvibrionaceae bacterium]HMW49999.1 type IV pilus modification protein PilV [Cellvibrionaceae bacterium]HMY40125.1 type IV pilus modification protein PilV [Marinagarivorans sp.]HNG58928.1 type IV pilus modification protein PilV [Cellvibrionaceae bacterium]